MIAPTTRTSCPFCVDYETKKHLKAGSESTRQMSCTQQKPPNLLWKDELKTEQPSITNEHSHIFHSKSQSFPTRLHICSASWDATAVLDSNLQHNIYEPLRQSGDSYMNKCFSRGFNSNHAGRLRKVQPVSMDLGVIRFSSLRWTLLLCSHILMTFSPRLRDLPTSLLHGPYLLLLAGSRLEQSFFLRESTWWPYFSAESGLK